MGAKKILIVDDEAGLRKALTRVLLKEGYNIFSVESGEKALRHLEQNEIDLVIADLVMPGISGIELLKKIKQISPSIKMIIMTAYGSYETAQEAVKIGVCDYIEKPFNLGAFKASVGKALSIRQKTKTVYHEKVEGKGESASWIRIVQNAVKDTVIKKMIPQAKTSAMVIKKAATRVGEKTVPTIKASYIATKKGTKSAAKQIVKFKNKIVPLAKKSFVSVGRTITNITAYQIGKGPKKTKIKEKEVDDCKLEIED